MLMIPFPLVIAEFIIFFLAVKEWGFLNTLGFYLLPCLLGFFIVTIIGRVAVMSMQTSVMRGQLPGNKLLNSGAVFLSGLLFLVPSFFTRVLGVILLLPGLRHLAIWRFKLFLAKKMAAGMGAGGGGFKFYGFRAGPGNGFERGGFGDVGEEARTEREVRAEVLDVTPLKVTHEVKRDDSEEK